MEDYKDTHAFDIFLSYSTESDYRLARRLESFIERFHRSRTAKDKKLGELSACLDGSDFVLSPRDRSKAQREAPDAVVFVPEVVEQHLAKSRQLLVLCSPQSMRSPWVRSEIQWFLEQRGAGAIRLAITHGDPAGVRPESFFAPEIINAGLDKTVWYDFRGFYRDERRQSKVRDLDSEMLRLVADLHSRSASSIQTLWEREQQQRIRLRYFAIATMLSLAAILGSIAYVNWKETQVEKAWRIEEASQKQVARAYRRQYSDPVTSTALAFEAHRNRESDLTAEALDTVHRVLIERRRIAAEERALVKPEEFSFLVQANKGKRFTRLSQNGDRVLLVTESRGNPYSPELKGDVFVLDNQTLESVKLDGCDNETQTYRLEYAGFIGEDKIIVARAFYVDLYGVDGHCLARRSFQLRATKTPITAAGGLLHDVFFIVGSGAGCVWVEEYRGKWLVEPAYELSAVSHCDDKKNADAVVDIQVDPSKTLGLIQFQSGRIDLFAMDGPRGKPKRRSVLQEGALSMVFNPKKGANAFVVATAATAALPPRVIRWDVSNRQPVLVGEYDVRDHPSNIDFIGVSADGESLLALDSACVLRIWNFETRELLFSRPPDGLSCPASNLVSQSGNH